MFRLDNEAITEAKDPTFKKVETSTLSGLRRENDVMVRKRGRLGQRGLPLASSSFHYC